MDCFERSDGKEVWFKKAPDGSVIGFEIYFPAPVPVGDLLDMANRTKATKEDAQKRAAELKKILLDKTRKGKE